ncbi:hypothetical protein FQR65_LT06801 [Abscondita terminalis]|nr:hypothetical protein FQR65_LT06801 [Abscondita terminalis]
MFFFGKECKEGVPYKENDCNNCRCGGGVLACTFKLCPTPKSNELRNCVTGTEWKDGCNDCVCDEELKTICTNNPC